MQFFKSLSIFSHLCIVPVFKKFHKADGVKNDVNDAANKGLVSAISKYVKIALEGDGIPKNKDETTRYFKIDAEKGDKSNLKIIYFKSKKDALFKKKKCKGVFLLNSFYKTGNLKFL